MSIISSLKRVVAPPVKIHSCAPRNKNGMVLVMLVIIPFEKLSPTPELMNLIKHPELCIQIEILMKDQFSVAGLIPILIPPRNRLQQLAGKGDFSALAGPGK